MNIKFNAITFTLVLLFMGAIANGQGMAINTAGLSADASAILDVSSTTKGILPPRMNAAQRTTITSPANGLLVYDSSLGSFFVNNGTPLTPVWTSLGNGLPAGTNGQALQLVGGVPTWVGTTLSIGMSYGGGVVAYILQPGDIGYNPVEQHGLIAATSDLYVAPVWYNGSYFNTNALGTIIGTGRSNTNLAIANQGAGSYAVSLCYSYTGGGYTDWYLPSKDELNKLYNNQITIGGFTTWHNYWSSSEYGIYWAWNEDFSTGFQSITFKNAPNSVRPVRSF